MRVMNRISHAAQNARIFQLEIFWPTLESIYSLRQATATLDGEENNILKGMIANRSMVDIEDTLLRQQQIAATRADILAEIERKWALIHAGCQFIAMMMNEGRTASEPALTPQSVYTSIVRDGMDIDGLMTLAHG